MLEVEGSGLHDSMCIDDDAETAISFNALQSKLPHVGSSPPFQDYASIAGYLARRLTTTDAARY